jgi:leucyl aminopeptidase
MIEQADTDTPDGRKAIQETAAGEKTSSPRLGLRRSPTVTVQFTNRLPGPADALVVGIWQGGNPTAATRTLGAAAWISRALEQIPAFTGKSGNAVILHPPICDTSGTPLPPRLVVAGLGQFGAIDGETARRCGAEVGAVLAANGISSAAVDLGLDPAMAAFFALGLRLRTAHGPDYATNRDNDDQPTLSLVTIRVSDPRLAQAAWQKLSAAAEGVELTRMLTALPANHLTPSHLAAHARAQEPLGLDVEILSADDLAAEGLNLLLSVGQGSANPPCLAILRWRGAPDPTTPPTLLVGKGITFDTGGLCIKPADGMEEMKGDMGGAAVLLGVMHALAEAKATVNVTAVLAIAENAVSGSASRPGDILTSHAGITVEVIDTDAEGRLALADALSWGCAHEKPRMVVDLATLTGSIVIALGNHYAGLFCNDDRMARGLIRSGEATDEPLWRMPLGGDFSDDLRSDCADVKQCASAGRLLPDALHAASFLSRFVPPGIPWAHLDIAGVSERKTPHAHMPSGASGFGVLCLFDWLTG